MTVPAMLFRSLVIATLIGAGASIAAADDVPCRALETQLNAYTLADANQATDDGGMEFLSAALGLDAKPPQSAGKIRPVRTQTFPGAAEAIQALHLEPSIETELNAAFGELGAYFVVRDLRPRSPIVVFAQTAGQLYCTFADVVDLQAPIHSLGKVDLCAPDKFEVLDAGDSAYLATFSDHVNRARIAYTIDLFDPTDTDKPLCSVSVNFEVSGRIAGWSVEPGVDEGLANSIRALLEPVLVQHLDGAGLESALAPMRPKFSLPSQFAEVFATADPVGASALAHLGLSDVAWSPNEDFFEIPEEVYYAISVDGHPCVLGFGEPQSPLWGPMRFSELEILEWDGQRLRPILRGSLDKHGVSPAIELSANRNGK